MNTPPKGGEEMREVSQETAIALGNTAITVAIGEQEFELDQLEQDVMVHASNGGEVRDVAEELSLTEEDIERARDSIINKFDVPNMAAVVSVAISEKKLPFEHDVTRKRPFLSEEEKEVLRLIARGKFNGEIAKKYGKSKKAQLNFNKGIFDKLGATGRTHSVRRCYELGIFKVF